jgi:His-Xaa-Ser system protein HxsD
MIFRFSKKIYPLSVLLKSAYSFTDRAYLHLDEDSSDFIVDVSFKDDNCFDYREFENEMLVQAVRHEVYRQTRDIRTLTVARALASTVVGTLPDDDDSGEDTTDMRDILSDWFEKND